MYSAGAGKMHRSFASLKMTTWIDAVDSRTRRQKTPRKFRIAIRSIYYIRERFEHAVGRVCEGTTQAMHYR